MSTEAPEILLAHYLKTLKLPTFQREYQKLARQCATEGVDHTGYLARLAELEMIERDRRKVERRIKAARFPVGKSLDRLHFAAITQTNKMMVLELIYEKRRGGNRWVRQGNLQRGVASE